MSNPPPDKSQVEIPPLSRKIDPDEPILFVVGVSDPENEEYRDKHGFGIIVVDAKSCVLCRVPHRSDSLGTSQNRAALGAALTVCDIIKRDEISGKPTIRTVEQYLYKHLSKIIVENYCTKTVPNFDLIEKVLGHGEISRRIIFERVTDKSDNLLKQAKEMAKDARNSGGNATWKPSPKIRPRKR